MIRLIDGTSSAVSVWRGREWKLTALGRKFYGGVTVRYVVSSPVFVDIARARGTVYRREAWLSSTAVELG